MSYRLTKRAEADLIDIYQFGVKNFGVRQAERYDEKLHTVFDLIARNPLIAFERNNVRQGLRIHSYGAHVIFYQVDGDEALIIRILGAGQDWLRHI